MFNGCSCKRLRRTWHDWLPVCCEDATANDAEPQLQLVPLPFKIHMERKVGVSEKEPKKNLAIMAGQKTTNSFLVEFLRGCFRNRRDAEWGILDEKKDRAFELGYKLSSLLARFLFLVSLKEPEEVIRRLVKFGASLKVLVADDQNSVIVEKVTTVLKMTYKELRDRNITEPDKVKDQRIMDAEFKLLIEFYGVDKVLDRFMTELLSLNSVLSSPNVSVPLCLVEPGLNHCEKKLIGLQVVVETLEVYANCTQESENISAIVQQKIQILWSEELQVCSPEFVSLEIEEEWSSLMDYDKKLERNGPEE